MVNKKEYKINEELVNIRLDKAISMKDKELSRMTVQRLIDNENILVNNKKTKASYKLCLNDIVTIVKEEPKEVQIKTKITTNKLNN